MKSPAADIARWYRIAMIGSIALPALLYAGVAGSTHARALDEARDRSERASRSEMLPFDAVVSHERATLLAQWRHEMLVLGAFTFPLALCLAFVCSLAERNARRLAAAELAHRDEADQRLRAESSLRQAQKLDALGQITGGIAHDFNNVLMVVATGNALARRQAAAGASPDRALASIEQAVKTGTQLTRQLLSFARRQPLQASNVRLQQLLPPLVSLIQTTVGGAIRVEAKVDDAVGAVRVDRAEFELALINLAVNARDAMPKGGTLAVHAAPAAMQATDPVGMHFVAIVVSDTGDGIDPEIRERVFEPFFSTKPPGLGTGLGLGLAQVHGFVTQAGGEVRLESAVGVGTTVTLRLPIALGQPDEAGAGTGELPKLSGRLLLVEDNAAVGAALGPLLEQLGLDVEHCPDAEEALLLLRERAGEFDVVLSDIVMTGSRSGIELAAAIGTAHAGLPVVLMSGYAPELQRAGTAGIAVLPKPCTPAALGAALERALAGRGDAPPA
ncbi:MAG TPA: ATP-binding protein [Burkholderiaceae bacterium]|jgi:signal transduction histidine kinase/CheY-like chemotaxis protein|nr:ATP-binding protein [Burkholderiaceae bacterium]